MSNMKPREKALFILTVLAVLIYAGWQFGLADAFDSVANANTAIDEQREEFDENLERLRDIYVIEKKYRQIGQNPLDETKNKRPITVFAEFVNELSKEHGFQYPEIRSEVEEIEGVEEYDLLKVYIKTEGNFDNTVDLLRDFESNGLLFREMDLRGTRDRDHLVSRVTVARIARREQGGGEGGGGLFAGSNR